jgi:molybdopterin-guanine dinucleotide biosynthesis protein A
LNLLVIDASQVQRFNPGDMFFNINNQEDLAAAKAKCIAACEDSGR